MVLTNVLNNNIFMGIDVSKDTLDIHLAGNSFKIANKDEEILSFIAKELGFLSINLCVLEHTGGYEKRIFKLLQEHDIPVHRAHPSRIHNFAIVSNHYAKTDKLDALLLSKYAQFVSAVEKGDNRVDPAVERLKELRRLAVCIEEHKHATKCRLKQFGEACREYLIQELNLYDNQLAAIFKEMIALIKSSSDLKNKFMRIQTIKGIAEKTAATLLAEVPELGALTKRQVASLFGVAPMTKQSGKKVMYSRIKGGRSYARKAIYMSALVAIRHCKHFSALYQKLLQAGKAKKSALVAVMRKMIIYANSLIRFETEFSYR